MQSSPPPLIHRLLKVPSVSILPPLIPNLFLLVATQTQRSPTRTSWTSPALKMAPWKRSSGGKGLTSPASSSRSWRPPSSGTATQTWAPERRSPCGPIWRRRGSGWVFQGRSPTFYSWTAKCLGKETGKQERVLDVCIHFWNFMHEETNKTKTKNHKYLVLQQKNKTTNKITEDKFSLIIVYQLFIYIIIDHCYHFFAWQHFE